MTMLVGRSIVMHIFAAWIASKRPLSCTELQLTKTLELSLERDLAPDS